VDEASLVLMGNQLLGQYCSPAEAEELVELAKSAKLGSVTYGASILSMGQSIANGGAQQKDKLLEIARTGRHERDAQLQLFGWIREVIPTLINDVATKGRPEGDAKREFRERIQDYLTSMYPGATVETIVLTIGQCFEDVPGKWAFNVGRCVLALRNLKRI
jgi:hypothetical protein